MSLQSKSNTHYVVRRLEKIHKTEFDHQQCVYILDVTYQGSSLHQTILLPEMFLLNSLKPNKFDASQEITQSNFQSHQSQIDAANTQKAKKVTGKVKNEMFSKVLTTQFINWSQLMYPQKNEEWQSGSQQKIMM